VARTTVATQAMRDGDFSGPGDFRTIYDPDTIRLLPDGTYTATPFENNIIPKERFKQPFVQLLEFYPLPNIPGAVIGEDPWNWLRDASSPTDWDQFTTRLDFSENANSQWFGRLSWGDESILNGSTLGFNDNGVLTKVWQIMVSNTRTLTATTVNELRLGANLMDNTRTTSQFNGVRDIVGELGIPGLVSPAQPSWGQPQIGFNGFTSGISGFGESTEGPFTAKNRTYQILDNVSSVRGNHTVKFGFEAADRRFNNFGNQFDRGNLAFAGRYTALPTDINGTGHGFASGLLGWMSEATRALGTANLQYRQRAFYAYFEDSWKITPTLTMNIGLRYENVPPWRDRYRGVMNVKFHGCNGLDETGIDEDCPLPTIVRPGEGDFHEGLLVHLGDIIPKETGDDALHSRATVVHDNNDFAPRIGLAWQVTPRTTVRTGYGIYYGQDTGNPVFDLGRNFGFRDSAFSSDEIPTTNLDSPWANKAGGPVVCSNWDGPCVAGLYTFANNSDRRTPYVQQYMLNVQRQLSDSLLLEVGYAGNKGTKLQRMYAINQAANKGGPDDRTTLDQRRPFGGAAYGTIQTIGGGINSNYNALAVKLQQRFTKGLTYLIGYTWSRAVDSGSAIRTNGGDNLFPANSYDFKKERGLSQFHTGQRFTASILYDLPIHFQNGILEAVAGGWQVGSIITLSEGTPFGTQSCGSVNGIGYNSRGDATGVSPFPDNPTVDEYYTRDPVDNRGPAAITCDVRDAQGFNELTYRDGNINRNMYISPGDIGWDFSLTKSFRITESKRVEFRFESFNFPNHPNWSTPNTGFSSLQYGRVTSAGAMRTNQFALKFIF
jgi:hypothetical protein